jgi:uncharacterized protein (DUF427 family)
MSRLTRLRSARSGLGHTGHLFEPDKEWPMKAIWNDVVVAESNDTVLVEGNHYFPADALRRDLVLPSHTRSTCGWKGEASYLSLFVDGNVNHDAVWFYAEPKEAAAQIKGRVAFWKGVKVVD